MIQPRRELLIDRVTSTTTSRGVGVDNAGRVSIHLIAAGVTTGIGTFTVDVSNNGGANWETYQRLIPNLTGTNSQTDAYVTTKVLNATGSSMIFIPPGDTFELIRVGVATVAANGTYSAYLYLN